jgi:hypothetical protein
MCIYVCLRARAHIAKTRSTLNSFLNEIEMISYLRLQSKTKILHETGELDPDLYGGGRRGIRR